MTDIDKIAADLRQAAFPGAAGWNVASEPVKEQWRRAAEHAAGRILRARDEAFRAATAVAHELGQHVAAQAVRKLRFAAEDEGTLS